jgi:hypothetical protein
VNKNHSHNDPTANIRAVEKGLELDFCDNVSFPKSENEAAVRNIIDRRLRHGGSGWGQYPVLHHYALRMVTQRNSKVKLDVADAG